MTDVNAKKFKMLKIGKAKSGTEGDAVQNNLQLTVKDNVYLSTGFWQGSGGELFVLNATEEFVQ